jgi:predicted MFS family arabinose efflux permease
VVGPGLAGYVVEVLSVSGAMFIDATTYLASALCIFLAKPKLRTPAGRNSQNNSSRVSEPATGVLSSVADGVAFVFTHPILRAFAIWSAVWNFSWSAVIAVLVLYATRTLMMSPASIGLVFAIGGIGGVLGSFAAPWMARRWSYYRVLVSAPLLGACGGTILLCTRLTHPVAMVALSLFFYNIGESTFGVNMQTCRQNATPTELMGRMDTTMRLCFKGMASLGALAGGFIGVKFGTYATLVFAVSGLFVTVLGLKYSRLSELSHQ